MINYDDDRVFFCPGELVQLKHEIENKPVMVVTEKVTRNIKDKDGKNESLFVGIRCVWFDKNQVLREAIFNTKDLKHI